MSIKIGSAAKNVVDVVFGTPSSTKKNIDVVKDWNGNIIWQRNKTIELTELNTRFSLDPWVESGSSGYCNGCSTPYKDLKEDGQIEYFDGISWITLTQDTHYTVEWSDNRVPSSGTTLGTETGYGKMHIHGLESGGYSGSFYKEFFISYTYYKLPDVYDITTSAYPDGWGSVSGGGKIVSGLKCTLTAEPASDSTYNYWFTGWNDGNKDNPRSFTVTGHASYTANFDRAEKQQIPTIVSVAFTGVTGSYKSTKYASTTVTAHMTRAMTVTLSNGTTLQFSSPGTSGGVTVTRTRGIGPFSKSIQI